MSDNISFSLFGCCVTQDILKNFKRKRAIGLINWISIFTGKVNEVHIDINDLDDVKTSNYRKRNILLESNGEALEYLFEEKADYLIIDCMDCRLPLYMSKDLGCDYSSSMFKCITFSDDNKATGLFDAIIHLLNAKDFIKMDAVNIPIELYLQATDYICDEILKHYSPNEIIINEIRFANEYTSGDGIFKFANSGNVYNETFLVADIIEAIYSRIRERLKGAHRIPPLNNLIGETRHQFGRYPLHYHDYCYDYGNEAIKVITRRLKYDDEIFFIEALKNHYDNKLNNFKNETILSRKIRDLDLRINNLIRGINTHDSFIDLYKRTNSIKGLIELLEVFNKSISIILIVKDTPGMNMDEEVLYRIQKLGFSNLTNKNSITYIGLINSGEILLDESGVIPDKKLQIDRTINNSQIELLSSSYKNGNEGKCVVNNIDYSINMRGLNFCVFSNDYSEHICSFTYDAHSKQAVLYKDSEVIRL